MAKRTIFISYHEEDERWKDLLVNQLGVLEQSLEPFHLDQIGAGEDWYQKIEEAIRAACVAILLVSSNSLSPRFILRPEVKDLLERRDKEGLRIIPVIVRDCNWELVEWLARLQVRPLDKIPLHSRKAAQVESELKKIVLEVAKFATPAVDTSSPAGSEGKGERPDRAERIRPEPSSRPVKEDVRAKSELLLQVMQKLEASPTFEQDLNELVGRHKTQGLPGVTGPPTSGPAKGYVPTPTIPSAGKSR